MKITAFVGSARKKHTYNAVQQFVHELEKKGNIEYEIIELKNYNIQTCKGCKICFDKGEEFCPLKDDRDKLIQKMIDSDGIIFASPVYSFQISSLLKIFIDRCAFLFHRPNFFGKTYTCIVAQGTYGGKSTVKYLNFIGDTLGCNVIKGCVINTLEPMTELGQNKIDKIIKKQSKKFYSALLKKKYVTASLLKITIFRLARSSMKIMLNENHKDYRYYKEQGWFDSEYYYPIQLNPFKKIIGKLSDSLGVKMAKNN